MKSEHIVAGLIAVFVSGAVSPVAAATIYSENFNNTGVFQGFGVPYQSFSDKYLNTNYYSPISDGNGWTFGQPQSQFALSSGDGAVLLNEGGQASAFTTVSGLNLGQQYVLSFDVWGDNQPGLSWTLNVFVDGNLLASPTGIDQLAGTNPGTSYSLMFTAYGAAATLLFVEASTTTASPIFDNVIVSTTETPIPAALPLFATGLGALGLLGWRRKRKTLPVIAVT